MIVLGAEPTADSRLSRIPSPNFGKYDLGVGRRSAVSRPFSEDDDPSWSVLMALAASHEVVPNYGWDAYLDS